MVIRLAVMVLFLAVVMGIIALLTVDLDKFKAVNDLFGHNAGDLVLRTAVRRLRQATARFKTTIGRLGGDEFAILVPDVSDEPLRLLAERITRLIASVRFQYEGRSLRLTLLRAVKEEVFRADR